MIKIVEEFFRIVKSYKPYARVVTFISAIIIGIAGLDASQVIHIFPAYADQINGILFVAGLIAPAISQEMRVGRAEELVKEEYDDLSCDDDSLGLDDDVA